MESTTKESTTADPTTKASTTKESTTKASTTKESTTKALTTKESTTKESTTKESNAKESTSTKQTTLASTTKESTTTKQITEDSTTKESNAKEPKTKEEETTNSEKEVLKNSVSSDGSPRRALSGDPNDEDRPSLGGSDNDPLFRGRLCPPDRQELPGRQTLLDVRAEMLPRQEKCLGRPLAVAE
ncbi:salivary glue protein Sgs-3-like [Anneissia japonica]|uniref:salivary glue protein Sgs-3-like n=1 Tax=Anneissia japonica TaxID=1529436 RepID=UPI0014259E41|nr:salivary glue protein Sgs-3-like [Anneissia japonica]